jgi:hypothetical protein
MTNCSLTCCWTFEGFGLGPSVNIHVSIIYWLEIDFLSFWWMPRRGTQVLWGASFPVSAQLFKALTASSHQQRSGLPVPWRSHGLLVLTMVFTLVSLVCVNSICWCNEITLISLVIDWWCYSSFHFGHLHRLLWSVCSNHLHGVFKILICATCIFIEL